MSLTSHAHDAARVIVCRHVVDDALPVLQVTRDLDGDWQFLCGGNDHTRAEQTSLACWTCMMDQDFTLNAVAGLWPGYTLTRNTADHPWSVAPTSEAEQ